MYYITHQPIRLKVVHDKITCQVIGCKENCNNSKKNATTTLKMCRNNVGHIENILKSLALISNGFCLKLRLIKDKYQKGGS